MSRYTVIGNSVAAIAAVEAIRSVDTRSEITLVSEEPYHAYSRPLISHFLAGKVDESKMLYRPADFYERHGVRALLGRRVERVDAANRKLVLAKAGCASFASGGGVELGFEKLLIATGARPVIPPIEGLDKVRYHTFTKWDDARAIRHELSSSKRPVVLGGGLIGIKAAEAIAALGFEVTVVELARTILPMALDVKASAIMQRAAASAGIECITENTIVSVGSAYGSPKSVTLKDGRTLPCDLLIVAVGVRPNVGLIAGSGIELGRGIKVDVHLRTSVEGIYAAGDVAEGYDPLHGLARVVPIWPNGYVQGKIAGRNMAGATEAFRGSINMNSIEINHVPVISVGLSNEESDDLEVLVREEPARSYYRKIVLRRDALVGAILVNCIDRAGILTGLITDRVNVSCFKEALLEDSFGYLSLPKQVRRARLEKLGFMA